MLAAIISKTLAVVNYLLDYFVVLTPVSTIGNADCGFVCTVNLATMTSCGSGLLDNVLALTYGMVELLPQIICGIFVV
jgi:hypothetical protein